jgi:hypothetical protein
VFVGRGGGGGGRGSCKVGEEVVAVGRAVNHGLCAAKVDRQQARPGGDDVNLWDAGHYSSPSTREHLQH